MGKNTELIATNFDVRVTKEVAMKLIKPNKQGKSLAEALKIDVMCKEYGDDSDWVGLTSDDYENVSTDPDYKTFEVYYPINNN